MSDASARPAPSAETTASGSARGGIVPTLVLVAIVIAVGLGVWAFYTADPDVDTSVVGTTGLGIHLQESGRETEIVRFPVDKPDAIALRILPVHDNRPDEREKTDADASRNLRQELRPVSRYMIDLKVREAPTLVVMSKWRLGAARDRTFHPDYLADAATMRLPVSNRLEGTLREAEVERAPATFETARTNGVLRAPVTLYAAQTLALPPGARRNGQNGCDPVLWLGPDRYARTLLARCQAQDTTFHLLADPDLVNNAGLAVGENAAFATQLVATLAQGAAPVYLDLVEGSTFRRESRRDRRGRSFADLARFFAWPFSLVWGAVALLIALGLWRAALRFGPIIATRDRFHAASKAAVIDTNARILAAGLAGGAAGAAMLREHARYRVSGLARDLFGSNGSQGVLLRAVRRRSPALAERLDRVVASADTTPPARWIEEFETTLAGIEKEFGR